MPFQMFTDPAQRAPGRGLDRSPDPEKVRRNAVGRRKRLPHHGQAVCMHWWDRLQPVNARLRAHFFSPSEGGVSSKYVTVFPNRED